MVVFIVYNTRLKNRFNVFYTKLWNIKNPKNMKDKKESYYEIKVTQCIEGQIYTSSRRVNRFDVNIDDYFQMFNEVSLAAGWSADLIDEYMKE